MSTVLYFLLLGGLFFLMMRAGCGAHVAGHGGKGRREADPELRWVPPDEDRDPVCGKMVATVSAKSSVHDGSVYYFCSRDCREIFEAAPALYVRPRASDAPRQLENEHA
ncbi:MAG: YHS domain-containing protein [Pseudomonadota bacterium]